MSFILFYFSSFFERKGIKRVVSSQQQRIESVFIEGKIKMKEWNKERSAEITEGNYLGAAIKAGKRKDRSPHESQRRARKR